MEGLCSREGLGVAAYFALARGFLSGKYRPGAPIPDSPRAAGVVRAYLNDRGTAALAAVDAVAAAHGASEAQVALAWVMARPSMTCAVASATSAEQVRELAGAMDLVALRGGDRPPRRRRDEPAPSAGGAAGTASSRRTRARGSARRRPRRRPRRTRSGPATASSSSRWLASGSCRPVTRPVTTARRAGPGPAPGRSSPRGRARDAVRRRPRVSSARVTVVPTATTRRPADAALGRPAAPCRPAPRTARAAGGSCSSGLETPACSTIGATVTPRAISRTSSGA